MTSSAVLLLSPQLMTLLLLIAEGYQHREIAKEMGISLMTVPNMTEQLRLIFGARNNAQLVALAYHEGVLKPRVTA